jgi:hypothetical protein
MTERVIRFVGRRRRICTHLAWAATHASVPNWEHDAVRRDGTAFRLVLAAKLARDADCPADLAPDDWSWLRALARFGSANEPEVAEFRRVVGDELPPVLARISATLEG